jgi:hypothetical protein
MCPEPVRSRALVIDLVAGLGRGRPEVLTDRIFGELNGKQEEYLTDP